MEVILKRINKIIKIKGDKTMRNIKRIEPFLEKFSELWLLNPEYRFGQLVYNLGRELNRDIFNVEEDEWLQIIQKEIDEKV